MYKSKYGVCCIVHRREMLQTENLHSTQFCVQIVKRIQQMIDDEYLCQLS
jgi:hypothetical protein